MSDLHFIVGEDDVPGWVKEIGVPPGWLVGRYTGSDVQRPWRVSVCGAQGDGGWDACETVTVFGFTGELAAGALQRRAEDALRSQGGLEIASTIVVADEKSRACAIRCSGYLTAGGLLIWTMQSYYSVSSESPGEGRLIEHCLFAEASARPELEGLTVELGDRAMCGFVSATT